MRKAELEQQIALKTTIDANSVQRSQVRYRRVNMVDLELSLYYMLHHEITLIRYIDGPAYDALADWLTVLVRVSRRKTTFCCCNLN